MRETYFEGEIIKDKKIREEKLENYEFIDCEFKNCDFENCKILGCSFVNCSFNKCNIISLISQYSDIKDATFTNCNIIGIQWRDFKASGRYSHTIYKLKDCYLKYNSFLGMNFKKFDFSSNVIQESVFEECDLVESSFKDCTLDATQIYKCNISKADFRGARGYAIDITSNKMKEARFSYPEVVSLLDSLGIKIE